MANQSLASSRNGCSRAPAVPDVCFGKGVPRPEEMKSSRNLENCVPLQTTEQLERLHITMEMCVHEKTCEGLPRLKVQCFLSICHMALGQRICGSCWPRARRARKSARLERHGRGWFVASPFLSVVLFQSRRFPLRWFPGRKEGRNSGNLPWRRPRTSPADRRFVRVARSAPREHARRNKTAGRWPRRQFLIRGRPEKCEGGSERKTEKERKGKRWRRRKREGIPLKGQTCRGI